MATPLNARQTDVPITAPEASISAVSVPSSAQEQGLTTLASAAGTAAGSAARALGNGNGSGLALGFLIATVIAVGFWMDARVRGAEADTKAAVDKLASYDSRMVRIEITLEDYADAAKELPEIRKALDRLIEDQRKAAGGIETLERLIRTEEKTP